MTAQVINPSQVQEQLDAAETRRKAEFLRAEDELQQARHVIATAERELACMRQMLRDGERELAAQRVSAARERVALLLRGVR